MITAQDIREKSFERTRMNGYEVNSVDDFLEEVAESVAAQQKELSVMTQKMRALVAKIDEYRSKEEAINLSILSAQKLAVQIEAEAKDRAEAIVAEANDAANARLGNLEAEVDDLNGRLETAKADVLAFYEKIDSLLGAQSAKVKDILLAEKPADEEAEEEDSEYVEYSAADVADSSQYDLYEESSEADEDEEEEIVTIYDPAEDEKEEEEVEDISETVRAIEDSVAKAKPQPSFDLDFSGIKATPAKKPKKGDRTKVFDF